MFSGIEAASLAWTPLGWKCVAVAEVDPFACAVLKHRFPDVPNLGDVTQVDWAKWRNLADVIVAGSPCQSFSVAGLRGGLNDERGNLTLEFVRAVHAVQPRIVVWENVPGIFSDGTNAFGCLLGGLVGSDAPLVPPAECGGRWTSAGVAAGPAYNASWAIKDARHYGVPQRRRRVFLVAVRAGDRLHPAEVLFVASRVSRDPAPSGEAGQTSATILASGAGTSRSGGREGEHDLYVTEPAD